MKLKKPTELEECMASSNLITGPAGRGNFVKLPYPNGKATFTMGSTLFSHTQPVREVTLTKPIAMQEAPVTVDEFRNHIKICKEHGISHGRFIYGPDGHITSILCANSEKAVRKMGINVLAGQSLVFVYNIWRLVPTMKQFEARYAANLARGGAEFLKGNHPVIFVKWFEAAACASLYFGGRLPTEAEWEYGARAGREGDDIAGTDTGEVTTENAHWHYEGSVRSTVPVKSYAPNPWGIYDMAGNVKEWTQSGWTDSYEGLPAKDPVGPLDAGVRITRGGSWNTGYEGALLAADRNRESVSLVVHCGLASGFRVVVPQDSEG